MRDTYHENDAFPMNTHLAMRAEVSTWIGAAAPGSARDGAWEARLLRLWAHQASLSPALAALAEGVEPRGARDLPCVPVSLFKELRWSVLPPGATPVVFHTSGTTGQRRGAHHLLDAAVYDLGSARHARAMLGEWPPRTFSLCPPGGGDSSLGHMVDHLSGKIVHHWREDRLLPGAWAALGALAAEGPLWLAATAFALDRLLQEPGRVELGPDSRVMVTGGFKGRVVRLDAASLYEALPARLGAPRVVAEYGMTELSSQLWSELVPAGALPGAFRAPPWLYTYAADPATGTPLPDGEEGVLRFLDLANVDSVVGIETMDLGRVLPAPDGDRVELRGRLEGAEARGCSLRAEEALLTLRDPLPAARGGAEPGPGAR